MKQNEPKLIQVYERLFVRGHTLGIKPDVMLRVLQRHDVRAVVNVSLRKDADLEAAGRLIGLVYRYAPMSDSRLVDVAAVRLLAADVARYMLGGGVVVHCDSGRNRSLLVVALALRASTVLTPAQIVQQLRSARPDALANKTFEAFVLTDGASAPPTLFQES